MGIRFKSTLQWLINVKQLEKLLKTRNKRGFAIVITVKNKAKTLKLYAKKLRFEKAP